MNMRLRIHRKFLDQGKTEQGHNAILYGAKILADVCYDLVTIPGLMDEIKADYNAQKAKNETGGMICGSIL